MKNLKTSEKFYYIPSPLR